jgi:hypothetical protein
VTYDDDRARVHRITAALQDELELGWVFITHRFDEAQHPDGIMAETSTQWEYRQAQVTWVLPEVALSDDGEIADVAIHEFIHVLMAPMAETLPKRVGKLEEFAVESLARMVQAARRARDATTVAS